MIQHCVFLRFKASVPQTEKQAIYQAITDLKNSVSGMVDVKAGPNVSPEGLNGGFVDGFIVTFEDSKSRDAYLKHPDHIVVGERIAAATDGGLSGILVFDLQV
ncbi:Dabb family protein [Allorhizobium terrae]|uniref:Dabb family protein n=1 Tax=Allorhizobium terrae TaxID=1848972 RepID=A0A4S3ZYR8_9HYPH|nr:Dabb family protein [Allorhizobium terrae]THF51009.1 Dabb family protein [Allorhizobium terrae]TWD55196.1 stress responsive alpha/beta barrel protein [Agrobacterium vitis]